MKVKVTLIISVIIMIMVMAACYSIFDYNPTAQLTGKKWVSSNWRFQGALDSDTNKDMELELSGAKYGELTFYDDGTYKGLTPSMYYSGNAGDLSTGNWTLDEFTNTLMMWDSQDNRDTLIVVMVNDSILELQLSEYLSSILFELIELIESIDEEETTISFDDLDNTAVIWVYKSEGEIVGEEEPTSFSDSRDGQVYQTVKIGSQTWMAENLKYLPEVYPPIQPYGSSTENRYYVYDYTGGNVAAAKATQNYKDYGVLYNWPAALNACPAGWKLPSYEDWEVLQEYLGGQLVAGGKMKETGYAHWLSPNTNGSNESGFTALPGGFRHQTVGNVDAGFLTINETGYWWSSTQYDTETAWRRDISYNMYDLALHNYQKEHGYSVRCMKGDEEPTGITFGTLTDARDGYVYKTVKIGHQEWMAENLRTNRYRNNEAIPTTIPAAKDIRAETEPKYQWALNGDEGNVETYGRLYTWYAIMDERGVCPAGWHVPSDEEWITLESYLMNNGYNFDNQTEINRIAKSMASGSGWKSTNEYGTPGNNDYPEYINKSGFSALPAGDFSSQGFFDSSGGYAVWWSSTNSQNYPNAAVYRSINYDARNTIINPRVKNHGLSVRCVKD